MFVFSRDGSFDMLLHTSDIRKIIVALGLYKLIFINQILNLAIKLYNGKLENTDWLNIIYVCSVSTVWVGSGKFCYRESFILSSQYMNTVIYAFD